MRKSVALAAVAAMGIAGTALAGEASYSDNSCTGNTFNRPLEDFSGLSGVGTDVQYHVKIMNVDADGDYTIDSTQAYDGFLLVYVDGFDPGDPLTNGFLGDDDGPGGIGTSQVTGTFEAARTYFVVTTGFGNSDCGDFTNDAVGPGNITFSDPDSCLILSADNVVSGDTATFGVAGGTPGQVGAVVWGTGGPATFVDDLNGWCGTFDFNVRLKGRKVRIVTYGVFDENGEFSKDKAIPEGRSGLEIMFQAIEKGTCPGECMSQVISTVIG